MLPHTGNLVTLSPGLKTSQQMRINNPLVRQMQTEMGQQQQQHTYPSVWISVLSRGVAETLALLRCRQTARGKSQEQSEHSC
ncbi:hypothetical protein CEXT_524391 [Caerostris extrusa]|uniref:Uncharacterized protein n=1 Tax=Caerostris extrusa TaxID=172846 RepID=A0AAV4XQH6_CAEEX|nr:hypothetical protein CEXT_524391 [Caerostris extrusa]